MAAVKASWDGISREELLKILYRPEVVAHIIKKAQETIANTGRPDAFNLSAQVSPTRAHSPDRPRAWIIPNSKGIRLEIRDGVLLKAALGMSGQ